MLRKKMQVYAHSPAGEESWDNLRPIVDVSFLLNFSRVKRPNMRRYRRQYRDKDELLLAEMQRRWGAAAYDRLKQSEFLTVLRMGNREFDTSLFTLTRIYNALIEQGFQVPQEISSMITKQRQQGNVPSDLLQVQTDGRLFKTKTVAQLPAIEAMNFCMNRAVQMLTQSIGGFRRNIRLLLKYWASKDYLDDVTKLKKEKKIRSGIWRAMRKVQSWNKQNLTVPVSWNPDKDNALQFFWLASQYYLKAIQGDNPPPTVRRSPNLYVPNPERVRFNKLLYANVGHQVLYPDRIGFEFDVNAPNGFKNPYADIVNIRRISLPNDQDYVKKHFKQLKDVIGNENINDNLYVTGYLGYKWDNVGGYNDAMPFYSYTDAKAMIQDRTQHFQNAPANYPNQITDEMMEKAANVAQYMSLYEKPPVDDPQFNLDDLPRALALNGVIENIQGSIDPAGEPMRVKDMDAGGLDLNFPPAAWWARAPSYIEIPENADARYYLLEALPAYGKIVDNVESGPNKPVRAVFKPALAQNNTMPIRVNRVDDLDVQEVIFDSLPALGLPDQNNSFGMKMSTLFRYNGDQQRRAFQNQNVRYQYGLPRALREEARSGAPPARGERPAEEPLRRSARLRARGQMHRGVTMPFPHVNAQVPSAVDLEQFAAFGDGPALPYIQSQMWDVVVNAEADTRLLNVVLDPQQYRVHLNANLDFYQTNRERVLRHFVHRMGW